MKPVHRSLVPLSALALTLALCSSVLAVEPLPPLPAPKDLPGKALFHGHYQHRSRGREFAQPSELWVNQKPDGSIVALAELPFMGSTEMVSGDKEHRPEALRIRKPSTEGKPGYGIDLEFRAGKAQLTRRGVREDVDAKELVVPADACFDPNSRPDSYCAANVLLRQFSLKQPGETKALHVYDWDNSGEALADYTIKVELKGKEKVQVPAGTFAANHLVLTQTSSADTWFKKRAGHTTDFWVLENGVIVRILRQREPYEVLLLDYNLPAKLPGLQ
ncbi:MAG TPA: hypothetical protein VNT26_01890 [Candidatus Sulfotelmatobacter sp.]|nr:hypothetical protein [Candidatus Sulfotelmatobacter sp.]HWI57836.1 hypothetical protein [Bacillota bacterium]